MIIVRILSALLFAAGAYEFQQNLSGLTTKDPRAVTILIVCSLVNTLALFGVFYTPDRLAKKRKAQIIAKQKAIKAHHHQAAADRLANM